VVSSLLFSGSLHLFFTFASFLTDNVFKVITFLCCFYQLLFCCFIFLALPFVLGSLSLMSLSTPDRIYMFDILMLKHSAFQEHSEIISTILQLFSSVAEPKIFLSAPSPLSCKTNYGSGSASALDPAPTLIYVVFILKIFVFTF
jgi:hypothetical protein